MSRAADGPQGSKASKGSKGSKGSMGSKASRASGDAAFRQFGALETGRLTWLGLSVALIGWVMLIAVAALGDGPHGARSAAFHGDLMTIAQALIGSGFALAAIGALQAGFGSLDRFFGAVLLRSGARAAAQPAGAQPVEAQPVEPAAPIEPGAPARVYRPDLDADPMGSMGAMGATVEARRPYRTFPDGSVEVETILGTRRFATMGDARQFI